MTASVIKKPFPYCTRGVNSRAMSSTTKMTLSTWCRHYLMMNLILEKQEQSTNTFKDLSPREKAKLNKYAKPIIISDNRKVATV